MLQYLSTTFDKVHLVWITTQSKHFRRTKHVHVIYQPNIMLMLLSFRTCCLSHRLINADSESIKCYDTNPPDDDTTRWTVVRPYVWRCHQTGRDHRNRLIDFRSAADDPKLHKLRPPPTAFVENINSTACRAGKKKETVDTRCASRP